MTIRFWVLCFGFAFALAILAIACGGDDAADSTAGDESTDDDADDDAADDDTADDDVADDDATDDDAADDDATDDDAADDDAADDDTTSGLTYENFAQYFMESYCTRCHGHPLRRGAPFPLTTYDEVAVPIEAVNGKIASGAMPPSAPRPTDAEKADFAEWFDAGYPEN